MSSSSFLDPLPMHIETFDFVMSMVKAFAFGVIIITISCYRGMTTTGGAAGVGKATTNSVVICYSVILVTNFILTVGLNTSYTYVSQLFAS
jgi:phospholipid/cholesterol/gamma-HCH transport system permease protein